MRDKGQREWKIPVYCTEYFTLDFNGILVELRSSIEVNREDIVDVSILLI